MVKGKQPSHLITLIEDYELDPFCPKLDLDLLTVLAHCHIIGCQYVHLDNLLSRYGLPEELSSLKAAAKEASR